MTTINSQISNVSGYNEAQYTQLVETAAAKGVDTGTVDAALLSAISAGQSFDTAVSSVASDLPELPAPDKRPTPTDYYSCAGMPSFGAAAMAVMVENTSEERRDNAELRIAQSDVIVEQMHDQADEMRSKAAMQLGMGIATGALSIGMAALSIGMTTSSLKQSSAAHKDYMNSLETDSTKGSAFLQPKTEAGLNAKANYDAINNKQQAMGGAMNQIGGGVSGMMDSINQYYSTMADATIKDMEADLEQQRVFRDMLQSLDEALSQQVSKALSTMESIQSDVNQTRTRILG